MDYEVRHIRQDEWPLLEDFLYEVIYVPEGYEGEVPRSIRAVYPSCYEPAVVEAFCRLHSLKAIAADIEAGKVRILESVGRMVGTGTLDGNHVARVFVLPGEQGRGRGTRIMDALEAEAAKAHATVVLDSSVPARASTCIAATPSIALRSGT